MTYFLARLASRAARATPAAAVARPRPGPSVGQPRLSDGDDLWGRDAEAPEDGQAAEPLPSAIPGSEPVSEGGRVAAAEALNKTPRVPASTQRVPVPPQQVNSPTQQVNAQLSTPGLGTRVTQRTGAAPESSGPTRSRSADPELLGGNPDGLESPLAAAEPPRAVKVVPAAAATAVALRPDVVPVSPSAASDDGSVPPVRIHIGRLEVRANMGEPEPSAPVPVPGDDGGALLAYLRGERRRP